MQQKYMAFLLSTVAMILAGASATTFSAALTLVIFWGPITDFWTNYMYCAAEIVCIGWCRLAQKFKKIKKK